MPEYRYLHYDVFTSNRFEGNALAVLPDARALSTDQMQAIANEMGFSETTFILPAEVDGTDVRMRIFTPRAELPMAGHPTIGSTFALAREGAIRPGDSEITFGLNMGPTPVQLGWAGDTLDFAWMNQRVPEFGTPLDTPDHRAAAASAVGVRVEDLATPAPQVVSSGVPFLLLPLRTRKAVDRAMPHLDEMSRSRELLSGEHYYVFTTEQGDDGATVYSRMFAPLLGVMEDPATGGACGPLGGYLVVNGMIEPERAGAIVNLQGAAMGRPSWISIEVRGGPGPIQGVRVGGRSVLVATGTIEV